ncbi:MAG TPA: folylpolyglutamate synthase/dihydrofolate synthase family protein [Candidatus Didemnitutus sp.]|nr:folylpolyglutamate synthase/dihydrofolate synthase family protein [Candidatus Didemnitutus sp.]
MAAPIPSLADYASVADHLVSLKSSGVRFGIERMGRFAEALGHPERRYPIIHLAGTNGKGSVAAMLESIFRHAGHRTGLYTSPHLVKLGERVQVNRRLLREDEIVALTAELAPVARRLGEFGPDEHPTFFEFMTAMAFLQFAREKVDVAIVETGMGGRLDATNIVRPEIAIITSIGFDHMEFLGDSLTKIAAEKAGIIKEGIPVVLGRVPLEAEDILRQIAAERRAAVHSVREIFGESIAAYPETNLEGDYQRWNAGTAVVAARLLRDRFRLTEEGIAGALKQTSWPGRWQRLQVGDRTVILDASHNSEGASVLADNLSRLATESGRIPIIITGVLGEYRAKALLDVVCRRARDVYLVPPRTDRACTYEQLEKAAPAAGARLHRSSIDHLFPDPAHCTAGAPGDIVVVTGSIYLLGEVLERLEPKRGDKEARLQDF